MSAAIDPAPLVPNRLLSIEDLSEVLSISENTIRHMRKTGKLPPPVRIGKHLRWRPDQILALIGGGGPPKRGAAKKAGG